MLDKTMSFISHINNTVSKASTVLNFIDRNLSNCLQSTKEAAYLSLVWEFASTVWDPYQAVDITSVKKIQRRASRWLLNDYSRYSSVTSMLQQLQWPTLEERHKKDRLSLLYKANNNLIALKVPPYYHQMCASYSNKTLSINLFYSSVYQNIFIHEQLLPQNN